MHVISGRFKGLRLATPKSQTRPTTERTKEAIFSRLEAQGCLEGSRVLDLFAGTGALGIEALSRGGSDLTAVEASPAMASAISKTFGDLSRRTSDMPVNVRVIRQQVERFVAAYIGPAFDLVFIDPPYSLSTENCDLLLEAMASGRALGSFSLIVFERSVRSDPISPPRGWVIEDKRSYGETALSYISRAQAQRR